MNAEHDYGNDIYIYANGHINGNGNEHIIRK